MVAVVENRAREVCLSTLSAEAGSQINAEFFRIARATLKHWHIWYLCLLLRFFCMMEHGGESSH